MTQGWMQRWGKGRGVIAMSGAALLAFLALPAALSALPALSTGKAYTDKGPALQRLHLSNFTPSGVDARLAATARRSSLIAPSRFRFTPSRADTGQGRAMTVAVRTRGVASARAVAVRDSVAGALSSGALSARAKQPVRLAPTSYNLGAARGWQSFALPLRGVESLGAGQAVPLAGGEVARFRLDKPARSGKSVLDRVSIGAQRNVAQAPRDLVGGSDVGLNVGGRYRVTRGVDVTAGVRYQQDRERIAPLTDEQQDAQAVYVGTLIRF